MNYTVLSDSLQALYHIILGMFMKLDGKLPLKDIIIRNITARSCICLRSISVLMESAYLVDAWILYRALLDRLLHLRYLEGTNTYKEFDDWSFKNQYEYNNTARSDGEFKERIDDDEFRPTQEQKDRYREICSKGVVWKRPYAEEVARSMDMTFLYKYGYDYASSLVHPMANDGDYDYHRIIKAGGNDPGYDKYLKPNTILVGTMILQEGLNNSTPKWVALVYNSIDGIRQSLGGESAEKLAPLLKLSRYVRENVNFRICQLPGEESEAAS